MNRKPKVVSDPEVATLRETVKLLQAALEKANANVEFFKSEDRLKTEYNVKYEAELSKLRNELENYKAIQLKNEVLNTEEVIKELNATIIELENELANVRQYLTDETRVSSSLRSYYRDTLAANEALKKDFEELGLKYAKLGETFEDHKLNANKYYLVELEKATKPLQKDVQRAWTAVNAVIDFGLGLGSNDIWAIGSPRQNEARWQLIRDFVNFPPDYVVKPNE